MEIDDKVEFLDTHMSEPDEEEFLDTSEKILTLSDKLAEEIILENIGEQLEEELDTLNTRINYVTLFREKYGSISEDDPYYDFDYMKDALVRVAAVIGTGLYKRFGIELGDDLDFTSPDTYLEDMETLYEFLFIRQYENLVSYFNHKLMKNRAEYIKTYRELMNKEEHSKDLFVVQSRKKFKNNDDVIILHFINEIITDIMDSTTSAYDLFNCIANLDIYEEYNHRMSELIINYGNKLVLNNDAESAKLYLKPMKNPIVFSEIRNAILMEYLEGCELDD